MLYNSTSLFTPIPESVALVDTIGDSFIIQTALGSEFLLDSTDSSKLTMTHRSTKDTIQNVETQLATAIPEELQHRVYCGEKTLDKKGDIFSDGTPSYICQSIKIDNTLVASGGSIGLLDVAISPDNATALVVVTENGKQQVYQVSLQ